MKKTTKSTANKSRTTRHSKSTTKPVTIDLEAESIKSTASESNKTKTSVPKSSGNKPTPKNDSTTSFGRNASSSQKNSQHDTKVQSPNIQDDDARSAKKPTKESSNTMGFVAAGLIGGCIALGGATTLQLFGFLGSNTEQQENIVTNQNFGKSNSLLSTKIADLETKLQSALGGESINQLIDEKLTQLPTDTNLDSVTTQVNETTLRVEKILTDLNLLQTTVDQIKLSRGSTENSNPELSTRLESLSAELTNLKNTMQKNQNTASSPTDAPKTLALVTALQSALPKLENEIGQQITGVAKKISELESRIDDTETKQNQQNSLVENLNKKLLVSNDSNKKAAQAIAAAALKNDIDQGLPFSQSLKMLVNLTGKNPKLENLAEFAEQGIATENQLSEDFEPLSQIVLATLSPKPKEDFASRLLAGAKSIVKVEPTGPVSGSTPQALVSQISKALNEGDLQQASEIWSTLPVPGKQVSENWHKQLENRLLANNLVNSTIQSFLLSSAAQ